MTEDNRGSGYFLFRCVQRDGSEVERKLNHTEYCWPELFEEFRYFLQGCGYHVHDGEWYPHIEPEDSDDI